jgi:succinate-acetate transporter protein
MGPLWRNRRTVSPMAKELGCGLITVLVFTLPLLAFSMATRGPRFAFAMLAVLVLIVAAVAVVSVFLRRKRP